MELFMTNPLELNRTCLLSKRRSTVNFSKISTKISFLMFFLSVICERGRYMALDDIVLEEKMLGRKLLLCYCFGCTIRGSLTMNCFTASVVISWGWP